MRLLLVLMLLSVAACRRTPDPAAQPPAPVSQADKAPEIAPTLAPELPVEITAGAIGGCGMSCSTPEVATVYFLIRSKMKIFPRLCATESTRRALPSTIIALAPIARNLKHGWPLGRVGQRRRPIPAVWCARARRASRCGATRKMHLNSLYYIVTRSFRVIRPCRVGAFASRCAAKNGCSSPWTTASRRRRNWPTPSRRPRLLRQQFRNKSITWACEPAVARAVARLAQPAPASVPSAAAGWPSWHGRAVWVPCGGGDPDPAGYCRHPPESLTENPQVPRL